jgi:hypothetical protein
LHDDFLEAYLEDEDRSRQNEGWVSVLNGLDPGWVREVMRQVYGRNDEELVQGVELLMLQA